MSSRLLHISDVHLGATFKVLGDRGREQARQVRATFARVIDLAIAERVDAVLVAGDLFDSLAAARVHAPFAAEQFRRLGEAGIPAFVIAGNHDPLGEGSAGLWAELTQQCPGLTVFGEDLGERVLAGRDLTVIGRSAPRRLSAESPLAGLPARRQTRHLIALAHGSVERPEFEAQFKMIAPGEIARSGVDYLALGDWHSAQDVSRGGVTAWYSGAPEMIDVDEGDSGNVLLVTLEASGPPLVQKRRVGRRRAARLALHLATAGGTEGVARALPPADPDLALVITLSGLVGLAERVDVEEIRERLAPGFFRLEIRDESHLRPEGVDPAQFPENTVLGRFVRRMHEEIAARDGEAARAIAEDALAYGVALLEGRKVLG